MPFFSRCDRGASSGFGRNTSPARDAAIVAGLVFGCHPLSRRSVFGFARFRGGGAFGGGDPSPDRSPATTEFFRNPAGGHEFNRRRWIARQRRESDKLAFTIFDLEALEKQSAVDSRRHRKLKFSHCPVPSLIHGTLEHKKIFLHVPIAKFLFVTVAGQRTNRGRFLCLFPFPGRRSQPSPQRHI